MHNIQKIHLVDVAKTQIVIWRKSIARINIAIIVSANIITTSSIIIIERPLGALNLDFIYFYISFLKIVILLHLEQTTWSNLYLLVYFYKYNPRPPEKLYSPNI
jgi:hypothetical protein